MTDYKMSTLTALGAAPASGDKLLMLDVSDTITAPADGAGSNKTVTVAELIAALAAAGLGTLTGYLAPDVVALADASTITVNAAQGNDFYVTLGGNRTMAAPSSPQDGQKITFELIQDGTGSRTLTWASGTGGYSFGSGSAPVLSTTAGATDQAGFRYSGRKQRWLYLGSTGGF
jgi:hypothetical protein